MSELVTSTVSQGPDYQVQEGERTGHIHSEQCATCCHLAGHQETQLIGPLLSERVLPHHILDEVRVAYVGPKFTRMSCTSLGSQNEKTSRGIYRRLLCLFYLTNRTEHNWFSIYIFFIRSPSIWMFTVISTYLLVHCIL